jgi:hypothetical protein
MNSCTNFPLNPSISRTKWDQMMLSVPKSYIWRHSLIHAPSVMLITVWTMGVKTYWCWVQLLLRDLTMAQRDDISICQQLSQFVPLAIKKIQVHNIANGFERSNLIGCGQPITWRSVV